MRTSPSAGRGFTLIELLTALLMLSLLAVMSYRGLAAVLDAREQVSQETANWRRLEAFCTRFEQDVLLASPRPVRGAPATAPPWLGLPPAAEGPRLEFIRFSALEGDDQTRRVAYVLNGSQEIELWLWPGAGAAPGAPPARYALLGGVTKFDVEYLGGDLLWKDRWPASPGDAAIPRAVRMKIVRASGGEIVRVFALNA